MFTSSFENQNHYICRVLVVVLKMEIKTINGLYMILLGQHDYYELCDIFLDLYNDTIYNLYE